MSDESNLPMRQGFGATQQIQLQETASTAVAAQAKAVVEARYIMALRQPRDWDVTRQKILHECRQPAFATDKSTYYRKPIGDGVEGLGIRFVEMALRCIGNVLVEAMMIYEDNDKELHRVTVTDLEGNGTYSTDVKVTKTVERRHPADDGSFISVRKNSYGKDVYTVPANEDDLLNKRAAAISKAIRMQGLRLVPSGIKAEAEDAIKRVRIDEVKRDPDAERKRIADAFAEIGVKVNDLITYLGHSLDNCSPPELVNLRGIYGAIRDGEATWKSVVDNAQEKSAAEGDKKSSNGNGEADKKPATCSAESFEKKKASWKGVVESGKKAVNDLIATIQTKETLSDEQKIEIASWVPMPQPGVVQQEEKQ